MIYENWWHTGALAIKVPYCESLRENITADCLVIGGGFAGLHAALQLVESGRKVVLLEKNICGGSSSGQSGGFLTPESEEDLDKLVKSVGEKEARLIYPIPLSGVNLIINTVKKYKFKCDLRKQDSLYLSNKKSHNKTIEEEAETRKEMHLPYKLYDKEGLKKVHPGRNYYVGMRYGGSYGINSFAYTQEMKSLLLTKGVRIFEDSDVRAIEGNRAITHLGSVTAKNIILSIDKMKSELDDELSKKYYHFQTYIAISEPLSSQEMESIFPKDELMCWDARWDYMYYRPVSGNRIIVGGSSPFNAYHPTYTYSPKIINYFINDLKNQFPSIKDVHFTHYWSGLLDVTKDLTPIADYNPKNKSIQFTLGCAGLPWAAFCGDYLARRIIDPKKTEDLSNFLGVHREFFVSDTMQKFLGKRISFMISHLKHMLS